MTYETATDTRMDFGSMDRRRGVYADIATSPRPGTVAYPGADRFIVTTINEAASGPLETMASNDPSYAFTPSVPRGAYEDSSRPTGSGYAGVPTMGAIH